MEQKGTHSQGHFNLAFITGLILGGIFMFVLGTKKGRRVLEDILDEVENFWGELLEKNPELEEKLEEKTAKVAGKISRTKEALDSVIDNSDGLRSFERKTAARFFHKKGKPLA